MSRVDAAGFFDRLYLAHRTHYLEMLLGIVGLLVVLVLAPGSMLLLVPFVGVTRELIYLQLLFDLLLSVWGVLNYLVVRRRLRSLILWLRGGPEADGRSAWVNAVRDLPATVVLGTALAAAFQAPGWAVMPMVVNFSPLGMTGWIGLMLLYTVAGGVAMYFFVEFALQPALRAMAAEFPADAVADVRGLSLRTKLLLAQLTGCLLTSALASALAQTRLGPDGRVAVVLLVAVAVTLSVSLLYALLVRHSLLDRLDPLRRAIGQFGGGSPVTVLPSGGDELDELGAGFNAMVKRIRAHEAEIRESRARIVAASDEERRRIERNIHDGAQQQLVAVSLDLRMLAEGIGSLPQDVVRTQLDQAHANLRAALDDLRELARGLHPAVLTTDGLGPALQQLAARAPLPVSVVAPAGRFSEAVETAAYFVAAESLANVGKHATASRVDIEISNGQGAITIKIVDDGCGGAAEVSGGGLSGLADRVAALDGRLLVHSQPGCGTTVSARLPLEQPTRALRASTGAVD